MRVEAPSLLPLLRSRLQGDVLALLYLHPDQEYTLTDAAQAVGVNVKALHVEANRLVSSGFAVERRVGVARLLRAPDPSPLVNALRDLLTLSYGPATVIHDLVVDIDGLELAFIYGSWAARYLGERGPVPQDIDVALIGRVSADDGDRVAQEAQRLLQKSVDVRRIPTDVWRSAEPTNPFVLSLQDRPKVTVFEREESEL
ncbi:MAG TPA: hypothetical protein VNT53_00345 [Pseudolysinimonas sp.]|nr:hypothetical protein [Pseudolysinimonas sp.]